MLRQRLHQQQPDVVDELHVRASTWYEKNSLEVEALHHAAAANDFERAMRLVRGDGIPLHFRGKVIPVLNWLESLPKSLLDANPSLWVMYAGVLQAAGHFANIEEVFQAAEAALQEVEPDAYTQDLLGSIASMRALMLIELRQTESVIPMVRRALDLLRPSNMVVRAVATWVLGYAYRMKGDRAAASQAFAEAITISQATKNIVVTIVATTGLGRMQAADNRLHQAAQTFQRAQQLAGEHPLPLAAGTYLGLARIFYEWNDLDAAQYHGQQSIRLAQQIETSDIPIAGEVLLARLKFAQGDFAGAAADVDRANQSIRQHNFIHRIPEVAAIQVLVLLSQGNLEAASDLAQEHDLPTSQIQVHLAQDDTSTALTMLNSFRERMEVKGWKDEILRIMALQAVALHMHGETDQAVELVGETLVLG